MLIFFLIFPGEIVCVCGGGVVLCIIKYLFSYTPNTFVSFIEKNESFFLFCFFCVYAWILSFAKEK